MEEVKDFCERENARPIVLSSGGLSAASNLWESLWNMFESPECGNCPFVFLKTYYPRAYTWQLRQRQTLCPSMKADAQSVCVACAFPSFCDHLSSVLLFPFWLFVLCSLNPFRLLIDKFVIVMVQDAPNSRPDRPGFSWDRRHAPWTEGYGKQ